MTRLQTISLAAIAACATLISGCGPKDPEPVRIISARELLAADDCTAYYKVPFKLANESFLGSNPPTSEKDHVTMLDFESETGDRVHLTLDQSVSIEESKRRVKDHRAAYEKEPQFRELPGFGDSGGWKVGNGGINFSRPPYRVRVEASGLGAPFDDAKSEEAARHFAKTVDERLKKFAPPKP